MTSWNRKVFFITLFSVSGIIISSSAYIIYKKMNVNNDVNNKEKFVNINISGAVENPGIFKVKKGSLLREVIFKAQALNSADLNAIDFEMILNDSISITIPYNAIGSTQNKIKWIDINETAQLIEKGISKTIATEILKLRKESNSVTWSQIDSIPGVGSVTLSKLKEVIDLS